MEKHNVAVLWQLATQLGLNMGEKYPYKKPRLADSNNDLSKRWFVVFYVWSVQKKKLVRKRIEATGETLTERRQRAKEIIAYLNEILQDGAHTDSVIENVSKTPQPKKETKTWPTVEAAIEAGLKILSAPLEERSQETYRSNANAFLYFAQSIGIEKKKITEVTRDTALAFSDYLIAEKKLARKTHNKYTSFMHTLYCTLVDRGLAPTNPFTKIPKFKTGSKQHVPFLPDQVAEFLRYFQNNPNPQLWLFINFLYYTFSRPHQEVRLLRIKDIDEKTILIKPEDAKNDRVLHKRIPPPLETLLETMGIRKYPSHYYVFSVHGTPGPAPVGDNYFYAQHRKVLQALGFPSGYDLYGWKHTGVIAFYLATRDIKRTQEQCGHKSLAQTDEYLRDLGLYAQFNHFDDFPAMKIEIGNNL